MLRRVDDWWGSLAANIISPVVVGAVSAAVTWYVARRKRAVWVLEHVRAEEWTLAYRGRRIAWDVKVGQTLTQTATERMINGGPQMSVVYGDWARDDRTRISNFERGEELTLRWHDGVRRVASVQTREGQNRYEVAAADVRRDPAMRLARVG